MNRRGFLAGILAAGVAPMAVRAGVLMPVREIQTVSGLQMLMQAQRARDQLIELQIGQIDRFRIVESPIIGVDLARGSDRSVIVRGNFADYGIVFVDGVAWSAS